MQKTIKTLTPVVIGVISLAMLFYLVISGDAPADLLVPVLVGALSGLGVDAVHRSKDKGDKDEK